MGSNANVTLQILAADLADREIAHVEEQLRGVVQLGDDAAASTSAFVESLERGQGTGQFLVRVQDDIRTATADFKAGIISVEDYETALQMARKEAIDQRKGVQLGGKELALFSGIMDDTATRTQGAARSSRSLTTTLVSLASQATGASGALGGVARVAMLMGTGGLVAGAVAAGVAAVTALYERWTAAAKETKKAHDDLFASIEEAAQSIIPAQIKHEEQRQALLREGAELAHRLLSVETAIRYEREKTITTVRSLLTINDLEAEEERIQQAQVDVLVKLAQLRRISGEEGTKAFEKRRDDMRLEISLIGRTAEEQLRLRLQAEKMTPARVDELVALERQLEVHQMMFAIEQERDKIRRSVLRVSGGQAVADQSGVWFRAPGNENPHGPQLTDPKALPKPPAPAGRDTVDTTALTGAEDLANRMTDAFGLSIDMVAELGNSIDDLATGSLVALGDGFETVFNAIIEGGKVSADALLGGLLGAISKASIHEAAYYTARGFAALAASWFPFPDQKNAVSAAQYFKAAALMGAVGIGAGVAAGAVGGGPGSTGGTSREGAARNAAYRQEDMGETRVVLKGSARVLAQDPEFVQSVADAFADARGSGQIIIELED